MAGKIRSFLAIALSEELKTSFGALRARMDLPQFDVRWVAPANVHLTLRFLGDIDTERVPDVAAAAGTAARGVRSFSLTFGGVGAFPSIGSPRVLWVGVESSSPLARLERRLTDALREDGWPPPDKPYRPHLTIGRVKSSRGREELRRLLLREGNAAVGRMDVCHLALIRSELRPAGAVYTVLERFPLS